MSAEAHVINVWGHLSLQTLHPADLYLTAQIYSRYTKPQRLSMELRIIAEAWGSPGHNENQSH